MATTQVVEFKIWGKQSEFRHSDAWMRGFVGGRGTGKTKIGAADMLLRAKAGEPFMAVSPTYPMFEETTWPTFIETAEELGVLKRAVKGGKVPRCTWYTQDGGEAEVTFRTGVDPEALRGPNKAGLWLDEASLMKKAVFDLAAATLRHKQGLGWLSLTFTPKGRRHWTFEAFYDKVETDEGYEYQEKGLEIEEYGRYCHLVQAHTLENPFLSRDFYNILRRQYSTSLAEQELAGQFVDLAGLLFQRSWFKQVNEVPVEGCDRVRYWDKAGTAMEENPAASYTAGVLVARHRETGQYYIEDVLRGQWSPSERDKIMLQTARLDAHKYNNQVLIYAEQEGGSGGKESALNTKRLLSGFPVYTDVVSGQKNRTKDGLRLPGSAKINRAYHWNGLAESGLITIKIARWNDDWLDEVTAFPEYAFSDQVDATSGAMQKVTNNSLFNLTAATTAEIPHQEPGRFGVQVDQSQKATTRRESARRRRGYRG
jgi:predicted phage terminase large subunit-like protein